MQPTTSAFESREEDDVVLHRHHSDGLAYSSLLSLEPATAEVSVALRGVSHACGNDVNENAPRQHTERHHGADEESRPRHQGHQLMNRASAHRMKDMKVDKRERAEFLELRELPHPAGVADSDDGVSDTDDGEDDKQRSKALEQLFAASRARNMLFLWLLGLINNFHYNLVISAASELASQYGMKRFVALISFCNVFLGIVARVLNTFAASRVSFNIRMTFMSCLTIIGLILVSLSAPLGRHVDAACFVVVLLGVTCVGTAYSYGETVALTFVQRYPATMVGAWSGGTGISGVVASVLFVILSATGMDMAKIFLFSIPLTVVYWLSFTVGLVAPQQVVHVVFCNAAREEAQEEGGRRESTAKTKRVVLFRGREEEILARTRAAYRHDPAAFVTEPTTEMVMNLFGISWRSVPPAHSSTPPQQQQQQQQRGAADAEAASATLDPAEREAIFVQEVRSAAAALLKKQRAAVKRRAKRGDDSGDSQEGRHHRPPRPPQQQLSTLDDTGAVYEGDDSIDSATFDPDTGLHSPSSSTCCGCCWGSRYRRRGRCSAGRFLPPSLLRWWGVHGPAITAVHKAMWWFFFNLAAVYIAEYAAQFMAPFSFYCTSEWHGASPAKVNSPFTSSLFWLDYSYPLSQVCYQLGVFISRSSLMVCGLKIAAVGVISIIQVINAVGWLVQAKTLFISSKHKQDVQIGLSFLLFAWMVFVGLLGGASYVNVFFLILSRSKARQAEEELAALTVIRCKLAAHGGQSPAAAAAADAVADDQDDRVAGKKMRQSGVPGEVSVGVVEADDGDVKRHRLRRGAAQAKRTPAESPSALTPADTHLHIRTREEADAAADIAADDAEAVGRHSLPQVGQAGEALATAKELGSTTKQDGDKSTVEGRVASESRSSDDDDTEDDDDADEGQRGALAGPDDVLRHRRSPPQQHRDPHSHHASNDGEKVFSVSLRSTPQPLATTAAAHAEEGGSHVWSRPSSPSPSPSSVSVAPSPLGKRTREEARLLALYKAATGEQWQRWRELAMSTGSLYAMLGICCGTIIDVLFTNTFMKNNESSTC